MNPKLIALINKGVTFQFAFYLGQYKFEAIYAGKKTTCTGGNNLKVLKQLISEVEKLV